MIIICADYEVGEAEKGDVVGLANIDILKILLDKIWKVYSCGKAMSLLTFNQQW